MPSRNSSHASSDALFCSEDSADDIDIDGISLTSTAPNEQQDEYELESILCLRDSTGEEPRFHERWAGYPDERCTFEPPSSFDMETLEGFQEDCERGTVASKAEIDAAMEKMEAYAAGKADRAQRREAKRARLTARLTLAKRKRSSKKQVAEADQLQSTAPIRQSKLLDTSGARAELSTSGRRLKTFNNMTFDQDVRPPRLFQKLSTKRRYELAGREEPSADVSKLELIPLGQLKQSVERNGQSLARRGSIAGEDQKNPLTKTCNDIQSEDVGRDVPDTPETPPAQRPNMIDNGLSSTIGKRQDDQSLDFQPMPDEAAELASLGRARTKTGRYWGEYEALVTLQFCQRHIGDVRIRLSSPGPRWWIGDLVKLKKNNSIIISFDETCTSGQYARLCDQERDNIKHGNTWLIGFADTYLALNNVTRLLRDNEIAALWHHPDNQFVLVLYASKSNPWSFFDHNISFPPDSALRMVVRSSLPKMTSSQYHPVMQGSCPDSRSRLVVLSQHRRRHRESTLTRLRTT